MPHQKVARKTARPPAATPAIDTAPPAKVHARLGVEAEEIRDPEGRGKRKLIRLIRYDTIERLYRNRRDGRPAPLIKLDQRDAANRLQADYDLANSIPMSRLTLIASSKHNFGLPDAIIDAQRRVSKAEAACGQWWPIVKWVVIFGHSLTTTGRAARRTSRAIKLDLDRGLDALARHYGLTY